MLNFLLLIRVMQGLVGRGPVLFGLAFALAIPLAVSLILIEGLYPGGILAWLHRVILGAVSSAQ